jgi:hypothetical protein
MADVITGSQLDPTKQDLIASLVQRELEFAAKFLPTIKDVSSFAVPGAKSIQFPKASSHAAVQRPSGTAGDAAALTFDTDQLDLDQRPYVAWLIDSLDKIQSNVDSELENAQRAASALAREVDTQIVAELESAGVVEATAVGDITRDIILEMRKSLRRNEAMMDLVTLAIAPEQELAMLKIDEFTRADAYGSSNIPNGVIGRCFGIPIMVSNNLAAQQYMMFEKNGCAIGFQRGPQMDDQPENAYGVGARRKAMDLLYGVQALQLGEKGVGAAESPLIVKDAN